jgi:hypothetical protein
MALSCNIVAGILCLHLSYPADHSITVTADTNGLLGSIKVQGQGWHASVFGSDVPSFFGAGDASQVCVQNSCRDFRRRCSEDSDGRVYCDYYLKRGDRYSAAVRLDADSKEIMVRAAHNVAIDPNGERQSDFPLSLLDAAAEADPGK